MKKCARVLFFFFLTGYFSGAIAQPASPRKKINFDRDWKFHFGNASDPARDFNYSISTILSKAGKTEGTAINPKFQDDEWRTLQLPHDWAVELPFVQSPAMEVKDHGYKPVGGLFPETSIGWYRKHFMVPKGAEGHRFALQFDGIFRDSKVWINGIYLGTNESGYVGFSVDITDYLHEDKENVVVVRVDASQYEGWFYEGAGIYRHAWLLEYGDLHLADDGVFVHTAVEGDRATVAVDATVENQSFAVANATVTAIITDRESHVVAQLPTQSVALSAGENKTVKLAVTVAKPRLWSVDDPYLYKISVVVKSANVVTDAEKIRFGIRTIAISAQGLFVNGQYTKVKGVCAHQDHGGVGSALPDYLQFYRIRLLKELGANTYRTTHHAPAPELLDACDSLGLLVLDEQRSLNSGPEYMSQFNRLITRDRNHASVFLWCIGNEEGYIQTNATGKRIAMTLLARQKELDPTRTSTYAADVANVFQGVNEIIPVRGFNYRIMGVDPYHQDHPNQPILGTEMGSTVTTRGIYSKDTVRAYLPDEDITYPWWANTAEQWWSLAAERPWWMGGFAWTGFDYRGEPTPFAWPNINSHFGMMDMCGFPKNIYYYYQSWWNADDVLHLSPHWNWKGKEGKPIDVWVNSNADNVELFLNGKSLGKKDMPKNRHLQWSVPYEAGTLEAVGYRRDRKLTTKVETTGDAYEVYLMAYKTTLLADGKDATVINVRAVDRQGREVPEADNLIQFSVTGDARFIGVGNGDPSSHEADRCEPGQWQRRLFNGKCQIILQAGTSEDVVKVEVKPAGLFSASTTLNTIHPVLKSPTEMRKRASIPPAEKQVTKMLGADISFLPQLEDRGLKFKDKGVEKDAIEILKDHGFNYVRLRLFNNPAADSGYSPKKGFCDLDHTKKMATRVKKAGMKLLLNFHYSDYWADPQQQYTPLAWKKLGFPQLVAAVHDFTKNALLELKAQGTLPDMVQIGNEINHGMLWPDGKIGRVDSLAQLLKAGIAAVKEVDPSIIIMMHIALGGQQDEAIFWLDNMIARGVEFDVIGLSYYPKWHGTLTDLKNNLAALTRQYPQGINVVEYSALKKEVNDIVFGLPDNRGWGTCIWEPLSTWESVFDRTGNSNEQLALYDEIRQKYLTGK
jgi:beta-galactosidase